MKRAAGRGRGGLASATMQFDNRVTAMLDVQGPIVQAPMGWIARSQLAATVANAGAVGIIETSSGEIDAIGTEIAKMADLTDKPFGVNIARAFGMADRYLAGRMATVTGTAKSTAKVGTT